MKPATRYAVLAILSISALAACDNPAKKVAAAEPASADELREFSRNWNDPVDLNKDAPLLKKLCVNMSGADCPADALIDRLKQYGLQEGSTGVDLAYAFISMAADEKDGTVDQKSTDENFVSSSYRVMFGREPDAEGAAHHLGRITGQGEDVRKALAMDFLRSPEFNSQQ